MAKKHLTKTLLSTLCLCMLGSCGNAGGNGGSSETGDKSGTDAVKTPDYGVRTEDIEAYAALLRPAYHYTARDSWINDPNGLVYFDGVWHMCYQTNPHSNENGNMHWGHAVSEDLIHWTEKDIVLYPDEIGYMWSGTSYADLDNRSGLFPDTGKGIIAAYSTDTQHIGLAYSTDGYQFKKLGIVIPNPGVKDFRDPKLFFHEESGKWIIVAAGGEVTVYSSSDLRSWTLESKTGIYTECPDLFEIRVEGTDTTKWILSCGSRGYYIGSFDGKTFKPESEYIPMNYGPDSYAGILFSNAPGGRIIMINWVNNWAYPSPADGIWSGAMSLPVELRLADIPSVGLRLKQLPVTETAALKQKTLFSVGQTSLSGGEMLLSGVSSNTCKLSFSFDIEKTEDFRLELCRSEEESVVLTYSRENGTFVFDRTGLTNLLPAMKAAGTYSVPAPKEAAKDGILEVTVYLDTSTFELFVGDGLYTLTARIQPFAASRKMALTTEGGMTLTGLMVTNLRSIWFGDETPAYLHLSRSEELLFVGQSLSLLAALPEEANLSEIEWSVSDPATLSLASAENGVIVVALAPGKAAVTASYRELTASSLFTVPDVEGTEFSSMFGVVKTVNGEMKKTDFGYCLTSNGASDTFLISDRRVNDFTASVEVLHLTKSGASAIVFDWKDENNFLCVTMDYGAGVVKLWGKRDGTVSDYKVVKHSLSAWENTGLSVTAAGSNITAAVNGEELFTAVVENRSSGVLGLNVFNGSAYLNRVIY